MSTTLIPGCKYAQRADSVYITISLADVTDHKIDLTADKLSFTGSSNGKKYALDLEFFKEIETEGSIWNVLPQSIQMKLNKKEQGEEFWIRLLKDKILEKTNVTVDWDRYVDEDEQDGGFNTDNLEGGNDFGGGMGGGGGDPMAGMGGMDMQKMMAQMGMGGGAGGPGSGGPGGMDMASMMAQMGGGGGGGMGGGAQYGDDEEEEDADSDDGDDLPDLEGAEEVN